MNQNILTAAQLIARPTPSRANTQLCARVALMVHMLPRPSATLLFTCPFQRAVHVECSGGEKYWNIMDARLDFIHLQAGVSTRKLAKCVAPSFFTLFLLTWIQSIQ